MKALKTLTWAVALTVTLLAFCATSAKAYSIGMETNYDTVTFSATIATNAITEYTTNGIKSVVKSEKLVTKDLLNLLSNGDFAGMPFPTGSKLVIGWDWNAGDLLVVDKTGTNVLYDATAGNPTNFVTINFFNQTGAPSYNFAEKGTGSYTLTWYNDGSFELMDKRSMFIDIEASGPCTEHYDLKGFNSSPSWTDSQAFTMYGANENPPKPGFFPGTLSGSIKVSGRGKGFPGYLNIKTSAPISLLPIP